MTVTSFLLFCYYFFPIDHFRWCWSWAEVTSPRRTTKWCACKCRHTEMKKKKKKHINYTTIKRLYGTIYYTVMNHNFCDNNGILYCTRLWVKYYTWHGIILFKYKSTQNLAANCRGGPRCRITHQQWFLVYLNYAIFRCVFRSWENHTFISIINQNINFCKVTISYTI